MKKLFTLCGAFLLCGTGAFAQGDNTLDFVDADGNVVADGSVWEVSEREEDPLGNVIINSGLYVKNNTTERVYCSIDYQVTQLPGGSFQICFPLNCYSVTSEMSESSNTGTGSLFGSATQTILSEWYVKDYATDEVYGTCEATLQLNVMDGNTTTVQETVSKITVRFVNSESTTDGIDGVSAKDNNEPVAYYSLDGSQKPVPQKGINIVKYADGSVRKVVVK